MTHELVLKITEEVCLSSFHFCVPFIHYFIQDSEAQKHSSKFSLPNTIYQTSIFHQILMNIKQPSFMYLKNNSQL